MTHPDQAVVPTATKRILVVDDEKDVRDGMARALRKHGFDVETACDGVEAGGKLTRFSPDLLILDVVMPGVGGLEVCRRIRDLIDDYPLKIIVLTGYPGDSHAARSVINGADLFLCKPQPLPKLVAHINDLLEE